MVPLSAVQASNRRILSTLPAGLVAVFVGGTSGIGAISVKTFAKYARSPRVYIVGRAQEAASRIISECQALNPAGAFHFIQADVSLLRNVDALSEQIKAREASLNLLFISAGVARMDRYQTSEHLHLLTALNYYARIRLTSNLLPLLQQASALRRVVVVGGGGKEGAIDPADFQALRVPQLGLRAHLAGLITLGFEAVSRSAPDVSIVHDYPGTVKTPLLDGMPPEMMKAAEWVPLDECGERHVYLATSARYPPRNGEAAAVPLGDGLTVVVGSNGEIGSGMYSIQQDGEALAADTRQVLSAMREKGMVDAIQRHTETEFKRIFV